MQLAQLEATACSKWGEAAWSSSLEQQPSAPALQPGSSATLQL